MKVTFLEAEVPLTKTFYKKDGKIEKIGHPQILNYTSHEVACDTIEELHASLVAHAAKGHCFLKGGLTRPLVKEPRAGTTDPNSPTTLLLLDLDGIKGVETVEEFLGQVKLAGVDYIVQYSSSMGILPERGMSAHIFMLLEHPISPAILKLYLQQWNLTLPFLQSNLQLTRTYNALRWPLDITTCQNDKLIYIAPPLLRDGLVDGFEGERIALVKGRQRALGLSGPFPNAQVLKDKAQDALNAMRQAMGLKERPKTTYKTKGRIEYMARPDKAVVTGVKEGDSFVYLNLNGGDSWGYYHPRDNPEFIHNFKNEPIYKTSELVPEYWADVKDRVNSVQADADGKIYLAFRDFRTAQYYNGTYDPKTQRLDLAIAKGKEQLFDFLKANGRPVPDFIPDGSVVFDPHSDYVVQTDPIRVNRFIPSVYMRMKPRRVKELPPVAYKIINHALGEDPEVLDRYMNTLAVIMQHRVGTGTGWVLHGTTGTGKGLMLDRILRPLFGIDNVVTKRIREIDSPFNGYMEGALILWVDEAEQNDFNKRGAMNADIKNLITEKRISIRRMHTNPYEVPSYVNWFLASNKNHIIEIDPEDRRFNVAVFQPNKLQITDEELSQLDDELMDIYHHLHTRKADRDLARRPLNNPAKQKMILLNRNAIDVAADAILTGDLQFFWDQRPQGSMESMPAFQRQQAEAYAKLLGDIVSAPVAPRSILREELQVLLEYTVGGMPDKPYKFTSFLKHHKLTIEAVTRDGKSYRGIPVRWTIKPEWKGKGHAQEGKEGEKADEAGPAQDEAGPGGS